MRLLRANKQTSELAFTDVLTTLPNRRAFMERLETVCLLKQPASIAIIYIDLDHFKDVNDTLGHSTGDNLLRQVSQRLPQYISGADMVARFGGDEFAVLLVGPCDQTRVGALAANIVGAIAGRYHVGGNDIHITASVGCTCSTREVSGPEALMMQADLALYRAKEDGRNCFRFPRFAHSSRNSENASRSATRYKQGSSRASFGCTSNPKSRLHRES